MTIVDPEGEGENICATLINLHQIFLLKVFKEPNGAGVGPEKLQIPCGPVKVLHGNGRIPCQDIKTLIQNKLPDSRISRLVHQVGSGFGKSGEGAESFQERDKLLVALQGIITQVELEVIEGLIIL